MIGHKHYGSREGGVEVVVTELARRMAALGHEVTCYDRCGAGVMMGEAAERGERIVDGVRVVPVCTIDARGFAALTSSFVATRAAIADRPDVIHYHAEGPCISLSLAHSAGVRTVATIHGLDWKRAKWGKLARSCIKRGERTAARHADELIVLSRSAQAYFQHVYGRSTRLIPNGIEPMVPAPADLIMQRWGLSRGTYVLFLGRIVPEKRVKLLVEAFRGLDSDMRLVIAGGGSDTSKYEAEVRRIAQGDPRIHFTGFVQGDLLAELHSNAYAFVLPSDVEGMPMSLLEAMAYGRACVTSDIPECSDVLDGTGATFLAGDGAALRDALDALLTEPARAAALGAAARARVEAEYAWDSVVERTLAVYRGQA